VVRIAVCVAGFVSALVLTPDPPRVLVSDESPVPAAGAKGVSPLAAVRVQFTTPVKPETVTPAAFRLLGPDGKPVRAEVNCDLTGGVATLTPVQQLAEGQTFTVELTDAVAGEKGGKLVPHSWKFTTGHQKLDGPQFKFAATEIDARGQVTTVRTGPDGHLYAADVRGVIVRYRLGKDGKPTGTETVAKLDGQQIIGIGFDPKATPDTLALWVSHAKRKAGNWAGVVSRLELPVGPNATFRRTDVIVGLPCPEGLQHQPNHLAFGPDGRLYQSVGGVATLGGNPNWGAVESPLSAAVIVADVNDPKFNGGKLPCDVTAAPPTNYDPTKPDAPVTVYATGFRNALGLCWHSNGHLYTATNGNSIASGVFTPKADGVPAVNAMPHESLCRVVKGKYYGHPNPARGEFVLLGGNPTAGKDPWEVTAYPVGVKPHPDFDPALLYDIRAGGGNSANGMCEYTGKGELRGRLLVAYFSGGRCIQSFAFDRDGNVADERPLVDPDGRVLRFNQPLDVCVHPETGRVYLAVFGNWSGDRVGSGVESTGGGVWLLDPQGG
jgi:glucose/arabinose dehydrogenase